MPLPLFTDLFAVADALALNPHFQRLRTTIERAGRMGSCVADLRQALACCEAVKDLQKVPQTAARHQDVTVVNALTQQAVVLYARATATSSKRGKPGERGSISITSKLTDDQITDHDLLIDMRNRVIAHVYPGEKIKGVVMRKEGVFLVRTTKLTPLVYTGSVGFDPHLLKILDRQIPIALSIVREQMLDELDKVMAFFKDKSHPEGIFLAHLIDPVEVYGSEAAVLRAVEGINKGFSKAFRTIPRP